MSTAENRDTQDWSNFAEEGWYDGSDPMPLTLNRDLDYFINNPENFVDSKDINLDKLSILYDHGNAYLVVHQAKEDEQEVVKCTWFPKEDIGRYLIQEWKTRQPDVPSPVTTEIGNVKNQGRWLLMCEQKALVIDSPCNQQDEPVEEPKVSWNMRSTVIQDLRCTIQEIIRNIETEKQGNGASEEVWLQILARGTVHAVDSTYAAIEEKEAANSEDMDIIMDEVFDYVAYARDIIKSQET